MTTEDLDGITIPSFVDYIGSLCFRDCKSLSSISIPDSITKLGFKCFDGCTSMRYIRVPNDNKFSDDYSLQILDGLDSNCEIIHGI